MNIRYCSQPGCKRTAPQEDTLCSQHRAGRKRSHNAMMQRGGQLAAPGVITAATKPLEERIDNLERAVRLVLALHVAGDIHLDRMAEEQLRHAIQTETADSIMYRAGRDAHRDGAPAPGEYCVEGDAYRAGWYDADEDAQGAEE